MNLQELTNNIKDRIDELKSIENKLIKELDQEHQISDAERLLRALNERASLRKTLDKIEGLI